MVFLADPETLFGFLLNVGADLKEKKCKWKSLNHYTGEWVGQIFPLLLLLVNWFNLFMCA